MEDYTVHKQNLLQYISNIASAIKFAEDTRAEGSVPFLNTLVTLKHNGRLIMSVHRKPTHMDQYLHLDSNHHIGAKYSVINTRTHRAKTVSSIPDLLRMEKQHIREVLTNYIYPSWATNRMK